MTPRRIVHAAAPIRVCDTGGWTDTWVARHGFVFNIAVRPVVNVEIAIYARNSRDARIVIDARDFGNRYALDLDAHEWGPHPLLEASIRRMPPPNDMDVDIAIHSEAPAGASTGTSAAVCVALLGALDQLRGGGRAAAEIAREAHKVESEDLGQQSGVQDQIASAHGGLNFIEIVDYPRAIASTLGVSDDLIDRLNRRLSLVYLGRPHSSSAVHEKVAKSLEQLGPDHPPLESLRQAARRSRDAVLAGDLQALGAAMRDNTSAQAELHAHLVSPDALRIIEIASAHHAAGWKVNGAGGDGGSLTILGSPQDADRESMRQAILQDNPALRVIPIAICREGLRVW
jgi:D-glycero-alpha-D-manno-heptose-7-phosphate kinase